VSGALKRRARRPDTPRVIRSAPGLHWIPLGQLLVDGGLIRPEQLEQALAVKGSTGKRIGEIVVELGFTTERAIAGALAEQYGLEYVDLEAVEPEPEAVALLSETLARRYETLPVRLGPDGIPLLAITDPTNVSHADDLRFALGANFRLAVAEPSRIELAIARAYRRSLHLVTEPEEAPEPDEQHLHEIRDLASSAPTVNFVNSLLTTAVEESASDVHFEPRRDDMVVRIRVDGVMRELTTIPKHMHAAVASRLKIMGRLDIADRRSPQDGRISAFFGGTPIDLRIAVLPTTWGEQIVLRLVGGGSGGRPTLASLDFAPDAEAAFRAAIEQPYGAVVVCGPTGAGKTRTLYGALDHLNEGTKAVLTIEDPIEFRLDGVNQIEVDPRAGLTFASGLRTILRSDPDVLLVGEVRDPETAAIAMQAAMTGHLVLTSLHAHDAAGAVTRLRDLGVDSALLASALRCVVAQRLARRLCEACKTASRGVVDGQERELFAATGCPRCQHTGYAGRVALREVLALADVQHLVDRPAEEIAAAAVGSGMRTMRDDAVRLALAGITSADEIRRVTGFDLGR
jgi:type IV pilus assembly protein PilB